MALYNRANFAETTLAAAITTTDGVEATVTSGAAFPAVPFLVTIGTEILKCTDKGAGDAVWVVTRGEQGSTAATHLNGAKVENNITAGDLDDIALAQMADLAQDKIIGRATASTGVPEVIDCTAAGRALLDDANAAAQLATLGLTATATELNLINVPDPATFTDSLFIGGGGQNVARVGTNPVDPLAFEADGSYNALYNLFIGTNAGKENTTGNINVFIGGDAGRDNVNGDQNTFVGWNAGRLNTSGYHNTFLGCAGKNNTIGHENTLVGCDAGLLETIGNANVALGSAALGANISGDMNVAIGADACASVEESDSDIGVGYCALSRATGEENTGVGGYAGRKVTTGTKNTFVGYYAGMDDDDAHQKVDAINSMALGANAYTDASNQVVIGDGNVTEVKMGQSAGAKVKSAGLDTSGDITLGENTAVALDPAGSADEKWSGITIAGTAGATLAVGDLCYLNSSFKWVLADADAASTSGSVALGLCVLAAAGDTAATRMLLMGTMRSAAFPASITGGAQLYVSQTAGDMTTTIPTGADVVVRVCGWAILTEPNTIYFSPSSDYITRVS